MAYMTNKSGGIAKPSTLRIRVLLYTGRLKSEWESFKFGKRAQPDSVHATKNTLRVFMCCSESASGRHSFLLVLISQRSCSHSILSNAGHSAKNSSSGRTCRCSHTCCEKQIADFNVR